MFTRFLRFATDEHLLIWVGVHGRHGAFRVRSSYSRRRNLDTFLVVLCELGNKATVCTAVETRQFRVAFIGQIQSRSVPSRIQHWKPLLYRRSGRSQYRDEIL